MSMFFLSGSEVIKTVKSKKNTSTDCTTCTNFVYDEDYEDYICLVNLDEDDYYRLMNSTHYVCPYYRLDDEYGVVRKQN